MKRSTFFILAAFDILLLVLAAGCNKTNPSSPLLSEKSSMVLMKAEALQPASAAPKASRAMVDIPVIGGTLDVQSAMLNIWKLEIEQYAKSDSSKQDDDDDDDGDDDDGDGDDDDGDGDDDDDNDNDDGDDNDNDEMEEITVEGPFSIDISAGEVVIDSLAVNPGTFKKIELDFVVSQADPFNGSTIYINGNFNADSLTSTPFTLRSAFTGEMETQIAGNGIMIGENATVPIVVKFDLQGWLSNLNFANAQITNGQILIDNANNTAILAAFETNLQRFVEIEEDDDD